MRIFVARIFCVLMYACIAFSVTPTTAHSSRTIAIKPSKKVQNIAENSELVANKDKVSERGEIVASEGNVARIRFKSMVYTISKSAFPRSSDIKIGEKVRWDEGQVKELHRGDIPSSARNSGPRRRVFH